MKILLVTDVNLLRYKNKYYLQSTTFGTILQRYYNSFGKVMLFSRVKDIDEIESSMSDYTEMIDEAILVNGFTDQFLPSIKKRIRESITSTDLVVVRAPSLLSISVIKEVRRQKKKYMAEAMGCAWDAFFNHSIIGKALAPFMLFQMKSVFRNADYALYVTNEYLQKRYPCPGKTVGVSNVLLPEVDEAVLKNRLSREINEKHLRLMTAAAVNVRYKGQQFVIEAMGLLRDRGMTLDYYLAGGGDQEYLKGVARKAGVEEHVHFLGRLSRDEVFDQLDAADIYLQPSLQEGLPRAVIEAMSRGCPVIGARTAGIPELISDDCVVDRGSAKAIADAIVRLGNKQKMNELAEQNFENAKAYLEETISKRRKGFFDMIKSELNAE